MPAPAELLLAANRAAVYGQVARWLIHDLRNPSQALTLITELMHEECGPEDDPPENTIREATRHLVRSLETLDRVLRVPSRPADPGPVSLGGVLEFLGALHRIHRSSVALDLESALARSLPAVTAIDDHLEHALLNLLMNAIEACSDRKDGQITITAAAVDGRVVLDVTDNGPGVSHEMAGRLFEPFATGKAGRPMAGLGLYVARDLLGRSGGSVEYQPRQSEGARFVVTLQAWR